MKEAERNLRILTHITDYCTQIYDTVARFGDSYEVFQKDSIYRNAVALCILQIGELVGNLTEDFRSQHDVIPWQRIKRMRNIVVHHYGTVDPEITWETIHISIPELEAYCKGILDAPQD